MIDCFDRSYYIGASDTKYVMGNWDTITFQRWWQAKQGLIRNNIWNPYIEAGNKWEYPIGDYIGIEDRDKQIVNGHMRVNLDGTLNGQICEIKTHKVQPGWKPSKDYYQQVQVEMYANEMDKAVLVAYALEAEDYMEIREIDPDRLEFHYYTLDQNFIDMYLERFNYLCRCLDRGTFPDRREYESSID